MTTAIRPIETSYAGHRFRSRLEARWAVFLTTLGVKWQYEPQGFHTDAGPYLPDFYVPSAHAYIEVKGSPHAMCDDLGRIQAFARSLTADVVMVVGEVPEMQAGRMPTHSVIPPGEQLADIGFITGPPKSMHLIAIRHEREIPKITVDYMIGIEPADHIARAYRAARAARFEHGESGGSAGPPRSTDPGSSRTRVIAAALQPALDATGDDRLDALRRCASALHKIAHSGPHRFAWHTAGDMVRDVAREVGLSDQDAIDAIRAATQS